MNRADHFGLAQLYQIRGRVGRSRERAYAYLLVPARRPVTKDAQKRLEVLQRFSELGAGFQIASHDLEIRGAGNLLGKDQSGQIEAVGFELYSELLDEAVRELKGEPPREDIDPDVQLPVPAFIPDPYMPDVHQRLYFYKRLAQAATDEELDEVRAEIVDRCGDPPDEVDALCERHGGEGAAARAAHPRARGRPRAARPHARRRAPRSTRSCSRSTCSGSNGALRLTPDMKLVALARRRARRAAPKPAPAKGARRGEGGKAAARRGAGRRPAPPSASCRRPRRRWRTGRELLARRPRAPRRPRAVRPPGVARAHAPVRASCRAGSDP